METKAIMAEVNGMDEKELAAATAVLPGDEELARLATVNERRDPVTGFLPFSPAGFADIRDVVFEGRPEETIEELTKRGDAAVRAPAGSGGRSDIHDRRPQPTYCSAAPSKQIDGGCQAHGWNKSGG